jgi:hypothetical protein
MCMLGGGVEGVEVLWTLWQRRTASNTFNSHRTSILSFPAYQFHSFNHWTHRTHLIPFIEFKVQYDYSKSLSSILKRILNRSGWNGHHKPRFIPRQCALLIVYLWMSCSIATKIKPNNAKTNINTIWLSLLILFINLFKLQMGFLPSSSGTTIRNNT